MIKKTLVVALISFLGITLTTIPRVWAQDIHIEKLSLDKSKKKVFQDRDSSSTIYIDTLIMKDKSSLQFFGKKDVKLVVKHAEIGNNVVISGQSSKNNASNFDLDFNFKKLGSLYVIARGMDANNGTRTNPNGDAGDVTLTYNANGIEPQTTNKKDKFYLSIDVNPGGLRVTPTTELTNIYAQIARSPSGLRGVPQGQIYSGSPGREGKVIIQKK